MRRLEVRLECGGEVRVVGTLAELERRTYFEYDAAFLESGLQISPFHLPARAGVHEGPAEPYGGLHGVFNDSLPDGWGLLLMSRAFRQRGLAPEAATPLDRLAYIGTRGMGALTYHPTTGPADPGRDRIDLEALAAQSERLLEGSTEDVLPGLLRAGGSPGGARPKVLVGFRERDGVLVSGSGTLREGFRPYLVKFGAREDAPDAGAVEHAYARMAAAAGIEVPEVRLFAVGEHRFFAAERFDRLPEGRRHVHTLAGLLHADHRLPSLDYEGYLRAAWALTRDHRAVVEAFRRMVFNVLAHNRDDHAKNFAFAMEPGGAWRHTPAYDLTFSHGPGGEHTMSVSGEGRAPGRRQWDALARTVSIAPADVAEIVETVDAAIAAWPRFADEAGVARAHARTIGARLREARQAALAAPASPRRGR